MNDGIVLCGASAYNRKYYFNPDFDILPTAVQEELQILCVTYTEEVGGILTIGFGDDGTLRLRTEALEGDLSYDEIGAALRIKKIREEKQELFESLELFYKVFAGEDI